MRGWHPATFAPFFFVLLTPAAAQAEESTVRAAVLIEEGTTVQSQVVAVGRDLVVRGRAMSGVAVIGGSIVVAGAVEGDVVALGGDVRLEADASIEGDVFVLGGSIDVGSGTIGGRSVALPDVSPSWLLLAEGPALGLDPWSPVVVGMKLALLAAWMVVALVFLVAASPAVASTSRSIGEEPLRNFGIGLVGAVTLFLLILLFGSVLNALLGAPLVVLGLLAALVLKLWGMVAVFCWLGGLLNPRSGRHWRTAPRNTLYGLSLLGLVKLLPWIGVWVWTAATLVGIGAALSTKFGRREPWLES